MFFRCHCRLEERGNLFALVSLRIKRSNLMKINEFFPKGLPRCARNDILFNTFILKDISNGDEKQCVSLFSGHTQVPAKFQTDRTQRRPVAKAKPRSTLKGSQG